MTIVNLKDLEKIRNKNNNIVYCSGTFDIFHAGHVLFLRDCRSLGDCLVVGVGCDNAVRRLKGPTRPIINEQLRIEVINSINSVDYCFIDNNCGENPLHGLKDILNILEPMVYVVNNDAYDLATRHQITVEAGVALKVLHRTPPKNSSEISTSAIISKILSDPNGA